MTFQQELNSALGMNFLYLIVRVIRMLSFPFLGCCVVAINSAALQLPIWLPLQLLSKSCQACFVADVFCQVYWSHSKDL